MGEGTVEDLELSAEDMIGFYQQKLAEAQAENAKLFATVQALLRSRQTSGD